jgi:hypothetical protein
MPMVIRRTQDDTWTGTRLIVYDFDTDLLLPPPNMVRYAIVDVLDSVTAERRLARHMLTPYICLLGHHAHSLADSQTSHSSPGRPPMPCIRTFAALDLPISFVNIDIAMFLVAIFLLHLANAPHGHIRSPHSCLADRFSHDQNSSQCTSPNQGSGKAVGGACSEVLGLGDKGLLPPPH